MVANLSDADRGRLLHYKGLELNDKIKSCVEDGLTESSAKILADVAKRRLKEGEYILSDNLAGIIESCPDRDLWELAKPQIIKDPWSLLRVYQSGFPDEEIESTLNSLLVSISRNSADARRRYIIEAFRDNGTEAVLPTLNMLFEDMNPSAKVRTLFSQHFGLIEKKSAEADLSFVQLVSEAIENIEHRKDNTKGIEKSTPESDHFKSGLEDYRDHLSKAEKYLQSDPITSVFWLRQSAENLAKAALRQFSKKEKKIDKLSFGQLVHEFKSCPELEQLYIYLQTLVPIANFGSHDQKDNSLIDETIAKNLISVQSLAIGHFEGLSRE